jgi:hypothetical protein
MKELENKVFSTKLKQTLTPMNNIEFSNESVEKTIEMLSQGKAVRQVFFSQYGFNVPIGEAKEFSLAEDGMIEYVVEFFSFTDIDALQYLIVFTAASQPVPNVETGKRIIDVSDIKYVIVSLNQERVKSYALN